MNQRAWDKISPKNQAILEEVFFEQSKQYLQVALEHEKKSVESAIKAGVKEVFLSDADIKQMKEIGRSLWPAAAKKSETSAQLVEWLKEYLSEKEK